MGDETFTCVECKNTFTLSYSHQRWYRESGLVLPKRCQACLDKRRYEQPVHGIGSTDAQIKPPFPLPIQSIRATPRPQPPTTNETPPTASPRPPKRAMLHGQERLIPCVIVIAVGLALIMGVALMVAVYAR